MDEFVKILLAISFGVLYFWVLSRRKKKSDKPDEITAPQTKILTPINRKKTSFGKILADLENGLQEGKVNQKVVDVSKTEIKNPNLLTKKETTKVMTISEEKKLKELMLKRKAEKEGGNKRASEKNDGFTPEVDADDLMNKDRDSAYKLKQETEHPILSLAKNPDDLRNAIIMSEIMQKKY